MNDTAGPARRFLHVCYCCADTAPVTQLLVDGLAMRNTMNVPVGPSDGAVLGLSGQVLGGAAFCYDSRGPRVSPAVEVQSWIDPPLAGEPPTDPTEAGIAALGFAVPDLGAAVQRLQGLGAAMVGAGQAFDGLDWVTLRDSRGVTLDLVADPSVPAASSRMRHVRVTCTDLECSLPWYQGLGFREVSRSPLATASFLGLDGAVRAEAVRLRLPDEPFEVVLVQWIDPPGHGRHTADPNRAGLFRVAVGVDDTRASHTALSGAGWQFDRAPRSVELNGTPVPDMWICFLSDPDGVPFELVERPRSSFRTDPADAMPG